MATVDKGAHSSSYIRSIKMVLLYTLFNLFPGSVKTRIVARDAHIICIKFTHATTLCGDQGPS